LAIFDLFSIGARFKEKKNHKNSMMMMMMFALLSKEQTVLRQRNMLRANLLARKFSSS
jgi:hypothetical protein